MPQYVELLKTLWGHAPLALLAMGVFLLGALLAAVVVRYEVRSLLALPKWMLGLARRHLTPQTSFVRLWAFIFGFNSIAIFVYMMSGGLVYLPLLFDLLTGLNVAAIVLLDSQEAADMPAEGEEEAAAEPRAWVGFLTLAVIVLELGSFWFSVAMGIQLGREMQTDFTWEQFASAAQPRVLAYLLVIVPLLLVSALSETAVIKATFLSRKTEEDVS